MKIEVLGIDGMGLAAQAWRLSRDVEKPVEWDEVMLIDGPVTEFPSAVCHCRDFTLIEREIIASNRLSIMWARTSFVDSVEKFTVPAELLPYISGAAHDMARGMMLAGKKRGEHQDRWRRYLPLSAETSFCVRMSFRDIIKFIEYFDYLAQRVNPFLTERFFKVSDAFVDLATLFTGSREKTLKVMSTMTHVKFLHEGLVEHTPIVNSGGIIVASFSAPFWLRAHWVRHRPITLIDDLYQLLQHDRVLDYPISQEMNLKVAASEQIWRQLLKWRSCWLTQSSLGEEKDPWAAVIDQFTDLLGASVLPCADGICPQQRDAKNRIDGSDPGVPCPKFLDLYNVDISPHRDRVNMALKSRSSFWTHMVEERWPSSIGSMTRDVPLQKNTDT